MSQHYDAAVLGIGGMGSAALAHLALRGKRVVALEQFSPAHAMGSSHGQTRVIRQAYFEDPAYVPLLFRAYELWADLERRTGRPLYLKTGGLMAGHQWSDVVVGSTASARQHGLRHEVMTSADIRRRFPTMRPLPDEVGLYEYEAGILFPEDCILAHLQVAADAGGEARFGVKVTGYKPTPGGGVEIETSQGSLTADHLVITAGAWFGQVAPELGLPLTIERNVLHWFEPVANADQFGSDRFPVWILQRKDTPIFYGFPDMPGQRVKMALHHSCHYTTADLINRTVAPAETESMRQVAQGWIPDALGASLRSTACMYTNTPDEHFVIGYHPAYPQIVVAGGFSGHGYKFCSVVGEVLADLATQGTTAHPVGLFSPTRFMA